MANEHPDYQVVSSYIKMIGGCGCLLEIIKGIPERYVGVALKIFLPLRDTNSKTTHNLLSYLFWLNTLKGTAKAPGETF